MHMPRAVRRQVTEQRDARATDAVEHRHVQVDLLNDDDEFEADEKFEEEDFEECDEGA
jgi:hypothetical protein